jgi:transposase
VGQNFLSCDREQAMLLPPDLRDWLDEDHLAWFVLEAVEALDLRGFYAAYRWDGHGRAAHDPQMMVALVVYAYAIGERSSRAIERRLREDIAFRVIAAGQVPDHATIARFRVRHEQALAELFSQVLRLCADAGLVSAGLIAIDGSKVRADASDKALRSYDDIAREILEEAGRIDAAEDDIHGPARGDELPEHLPAARAAAPGCARPRSGSSASGPATRSRSRTGEQSGSPSASAGSSRTGARSASRAATTRPTSSAASSSADARRWARGPLPTRHPSGHREGSTRPTPTPAG